MDQTRKPDWWPDWMGDPIEPFPLGHCTECGAQQYVSSRENHMTWCSRYERLEPGPFRKVPWPKNWRG